MWKTILVPHDFSACADRACDLARDLARVHDARLVLLHVAEMPSMLGPIASVVPDDGGNPISLRDYALRSSTAFLEKAAERLRTTGATVSYVAAIGHVATEIIEAASREGADLIVMGTHGRTGLAHVVLGSVTEKVVRHSAVPVLTVRAPE